MPGVKLMEGQRPASLRSPAALHRKDVPAGRCVFWRKNAGSNLIHQQEKMPLAAL